MRTICLKAEAPSGGSNNVATKRTGASLIEAALHLNVYRQCPHRRRARNLHVHDLYRETISRIERQLKEGQENIIIFSDERMTPETALERDLAKPEQLTRRQAQSRALDEGRLENDTYRQATAEAAAEGDPTPAYVILGANSIEHADGVSRAIIRLFKGATPHDLIEEFAEVGVKRATTPQARRDLLADLRDAEAKIQAAEIGLTHEK